MKIYRMKQPDIAVWFILLFVAGFVAGSRMYPAVTEIRYVPADLSNLDNGTTVETGIPAVDSSGRGVAGRLLTTVRPGNGLVLVSINDVLAQFDTQLSGRIAAKAAERYTNISMDNFDVIYSIKVNASLIEGPSAGSTMAVSIVAALLNKTLDGTVMMTGTIGEDGIIGAVGSIMEKAKAAKENGAARFLVPESQGFESGVERAKECSIADSIEYCKVDYVQKKKSLDVGIEIIEVSTLGDALKHFLK